jgi:hypothetical protein
MRHEHLVVTVEADTKERIDDDLEPGESLEAWVADAVERKLADARGSGPAGAGPDGEGTGRNDGSSRRASGEGTGRNDGESGRSGGGAGRRDAAVDPSRQAGGEGAAEEWFESGGSESAGDDTDGESDDGDDSLDRRFEGGDGDDCDEGFEYVDDCAI